MALKKVKFNPSGPTLAEAQAAAGTVTQDRLTPVKAQRAQSEIVKITKKGKSGRKKRKVLVKTGRKRGRAHVGMVDLDFFAAELDRFADMVPLWGAAAHREYAAFLITGIVAKTPVLSGRAAANWQGAKGSPASTSVPAPYPSKRETIDRAIITFGAPGTGGLVDVRKRGAFKNMHITNNVLYIGNLEDGSSAQRPEGMVQVTLIEAAAKFGGYIDAMDGAVSIDDLSSLQKGGLNI